MDQQNPEVNKTEQHIESKVTPKKTKNKLIIICAAIIILIVLAGILFAVSNKNLQQPLPIVSISPTSVPLKTEYSNPFDEKSNYENPFAEEEYQNPFDLSE